MIDVDDIYMKDVLQAKEIIVADKVVVLYNRISWYFAKSQRPKRRRASGTLNSLGRSPVALEMDRIDESRMSFSSDGEGSDSELSPTADARPTPDWNHPNPRSGKIPGGQFELPNATPPSSTATPTQPLQTSALRERALSATDALFQSSRKRASSDADKTKQVKESGRRTLFSRPSKIMTNLAGGGKDKDKNKAIERDESPISPTYFRPFASPSNLRPRHSHDETHRNFSLGNLSLTNSAATTPGETSHAILSPAATTTSSTSSSLRPQLFHRTRKASNPSSVFVTGEGAWIVSWRRDENKY